MTAIDTQNARQIRDPMLISVSIAAQVSTAITVSNVSGFAVQDTNPSASLPEDSWPVRGITDLQGDGFPLDGSCQWHDPTLAGSESNGKLGLRTHIGGSGSFTVSAASEIPALTIYTEGEGTITAGGVVYEARGTNVIPVNATSISITVASTDAARRFEVHAVIPGINLSWDQESLISCDLYLRSDLSMADAQWQVSEIEIQAYYPDDISEAVTGISENVPITYRAGYAGDMSPERRFYISEPVTMENNIITIKGHDASYRLRGKSHAAQIINSTGTTGRRKLYRMMRQYIEKSGITLRSKQAEPDLQTGSVERTLIFQAGTADRIVADIMNLAHTGTFWPVFVDGGIPKLTHTKPDPDNPKWTIREEDCGDVKRLVDKNIAKITTDDEFGLHNTVTRSDKWQEIVRRHCERNMRYSQNAGGYFWALTVSNAYDISATAVSIWWTAEETSYSFPALKVAVTKDGKVAVDKNGDAIYTEEVQWANECIVKGKAAAVEKAEDSVTASPARAGVIAEMRPVAYGRVLSGGSRLYPNYNNLFERSNITGSFTWRGDPRMQPRDTFKFIRLDGTEEVCTIETITLKHEGGGTVAEISYRKGVC